MPGRPLGARGGKSLFMHGHDSGFFVWNVAKHTRNRGGNLLRSTATRICLGHGHKHVHGGNMAIKKGDLPREYALQPPVGWIGVAVVCRNPLPLEKPRAFPAREECQTTPCEGDKFFARARIAVVPVLATLSVPVTGPDCRGFSVT